jgi:hypothetical protein
VTAQEYNYLQLKYPLLVNTYSYQSVHELALASLVARRLPVEDGEPRGHGFAATLAQLRAQRTVFSSGRRQYYIPHSTLPLLAEVAKKGVPIILLGATSDLIVRKIHLELKKSAVEGASGTQVNIIWDEAGSEKGVDPHYGPHRSVWPNNVLADFPVAQSQSRFKGCIIKLVEILSPGK